MNSGPCLSVAVQDVEFAKDYQYFVTVQFLNEKKRTDVSAFARNPVFATNTMLFPIRNTSGTITESVTFTACVVVEEGSTAQQRGQSKILGEAVMDLSPFSLQTNEQFNAPVRQQMKFTRMKDGKEISVGRFIASFRVVNEQLAQSFVENAEIKRADKGEIYQDLPDLDSALEFSWRVRAEVRCANNVPSGEMTPQAFVEVGWTEYKNTSPQQQRVFRTSIVNSTNPMWNSTFLISNPEGIEERKGFIAVYLKDKNTLEDILQCFIPVESMNPFTPYNLNISKKETSQCNFMLSVLLECRTKPTQRLYDIIVNDVLFEPIPREISKMALILTTSDTEPQLHFYSLDQKEDSLERVLEFDDAKQFCFQMSQLLKVPPVKSSKAHRAATFFTVSESMLRKNLKLHLAIPNESKFELHQLPTLLVGSTVILDEDLSLLLVEKSKKRVFANVTYHKDQINPLTNGKSKCQVELGTNEPKQQRQPLEQSQMNKNISLSRSLNLPDLPAESPHKYSGQNNEILNRILKELDDRTESLKIAAAEVVDLRKQVKLLQSQNNILRRDASKSEDGIKDMIAKELESMGTSELKDKILKVAAMYRNQRVRVRELENTIKTLEPQVANSMQLNSTVSTMNNHIQALTNKLAQYRKEVERIGAYKETIKKQEKVIEKLERVATESMRDVKRARQDRLELEELRKKAQFAPQAPPSRGRNEPTNQSDEILRLQRIIANLQQNMRQSKLGPQSNYEDRTELQFRLHKAEARVNALEEQITNNARTYAKEIAKYKLMIAEKQALLDGFTLGV